jgi:tetratricopeptide (TPR) repeat protein
LLASAGAALAVTVPSGIQRARDRQDRAAFDKLLPAISAAAQRGSNDAAAQYALAVSELYFAEVALELNDKEAAAREAAAGIKAAERAVQLEPKNAEYHRVLGALCGQIIPANVLAGIKYGKCALESITKAIELNPQSADAWLSRGVGNYYLPPTFGGGVDKAIQDMERAVKLNPKSADAQLWLGIALRKANRLAEARLALTRSAELNPNRLWTKQQLEKTPAK